MSVERINSQAVMLHTMHQLSREASGIVPNNTGKAGDVLFGDAMKQAVDRISDAQLNAKSMMTAVETGTSDDLVGTMVASQKAELSFSALVQVRNRVVSAFDTIMQMSV